MAAQRGLARNTAFQSRPIQYGVGAKAYLPLPEEPQLQPGRPSTREVSAAIKARAALHRSIVLHTAGILAVAGVIGFTFLEGQIRVTREAHRSMFKSYRLSQAQELSHHWQQEEATTLTPDAVDRKAAAIQMVKPDERDTIEVP